MPSCGPSAEITVPAGSTNAAGGPRKTSRGEACTAAFDSTRCATGIAYLAAQRRACQLQDESVTARLEIFRERRAERADASMLALERPRIGHAEDGRNR